MSALAGAVLGLILQVAVVLALAGTAVRCVRWARTPQARPVTLTPAPQGRAGVALRLAGELFAFRSLWRATRLGWLLGWTFHAALAVVAVDHLWLFLDPVPAWIWRLHGVSTPVAVLAALALAGLLARRVLDPRVRYVSAPSDYLHLLLLGAVTAAGIAMRTSHPVDIAAVGVFSRGLVLAEWHALPRVPVLLAHLAGAAALFAVFPFSKLMHGPALFFVPTIAARDRGRRVPVSHPPGS